MDNSHLQFYRLKKIPVKINSPEHEVMRVLAPKSQWDLEHGKHVSCKPPLAGTTALLEILRPYDFVEIEMT